MTRQIAGFTLLIILLGCAEHPESNITTGVNGAVDLAVEYNDCVVLTIGDETFVGAILAPALDRFHSDSLLVH